MRVMVAVQNRNRTVARLNRYCVEDSNCNEEMTGTETVFDESYYYYYRGFCTTPTPLMGAKARARHSSPCASSISTYTKENFRMIKLGSTGS
jgi:hypothetical protein